MQGSLNSVVVWVPLMDVSREIGALEIIPGSHLWGLQESREEGWYRHIEGLPDDVYQPVEMNAGDVLIFSVFLVGQHLDSKKRIRWRCNRFRAEWFGCRNRSCSCRAIRTRARGRGANRGWHTLG